ncbi:hypothetical protein [Streptomyces sp. NPDC050704]|uniref:hypothetical protein n=1 Tax=Streptomyces sp. NPDC050704 TaxID=3157219 RepID=UPI003412DE2D
MATREEVFQRAVTALREGNRLVAAGVPESHPGYAATEDSLRAAQAAGFEDYEIVAAACDLP